MLFFTMPRLCPRLSDQRQRDGWPQHMVPHEFHHSPKLHGQNTPRGHNHDGDPDVWIKILSVKWRSIWIPSTYKSQLCKFWDVLFSSFKFCFNSNESFWMNPMGAEWEPNEFSAMQGTVLSPPKVPSKPSHEAGFSVMHLLSADRLPRRGHLDLSQVALEHFEDPTLKYPKQTNKPRNCRQSSGESRRRCLNHYQSHTRPIGSDPAWIHSSRWCHSAWITDRLKSINKSWTTDPFIAIERFKTRTFWFCRLCRSSAQGSQVLANVPRISDQISKALTSVSHHWSPQVVHDPVSTPSPWQRSQPQAENCAPHHENVNNNLNF